MKQQKSFMANEQNHTREWVLVDATGLPLGRLCAEVAMILRGKHKPTFTPHADAGDFVIVVNTDKIVLTGKKMEDKYYWSHSGHIGGTKEVQAKEMLKNKSDFMVSHAVKGMLPKNALGRQMFRKLKVYKDGKHPHEAQQPKAIEISRGINNVNKKITTGGGNK